MTDIETDVREFHLRFNHPAPVEMVEPGKKWLELRKRLIREEAEELCEAIELGDPVKIAREAVDVIYVAVGTLVAWGIPLGPVWWAVHRANMMKTPAPIGEKPGKPAGWVPPDDEIGQHLDVIV